jgi:DNA-binding NarL/FixJ family response regulator
VGRTVRHHNETVVDALERGREAFACRAWSEAHAMLSAAAPESGDDLERLAVASYLVGRDDAATRALEQAYVAHTRSGEHVGAGRAAFWLAFLLLLRGETARSGGWRARAERSIEVAAEECAVRGLLLVPTFLELLDTDPSRAAALASEMIEIAQRCDNDDLLALGLLCHGEASIAGGELDRGLRVLDEAMLTATSGNLLPICTGIVYCGVIAMCIDVFDLARATEWTNALDAWCKTQPDLVPFRGQCLVHRSQVLQAHGAWREALDEAKQAREHLAEQVHPALGLACYQLGELHRLRGEFADAALAYRSAAEHGRDPSPGAALLELATGDVAAADQSIRRMLAETAGPTRPLLLAAAVEISLAIPDAPAARAFCDELSAITDAGRVRSLDAIAAFASGSVLLAEGDASAALSRLRAASTTWHELGMPYDTARARVLIADACGLLGDHRSADRELESAVETFERLGARPDADHHRRDTSTVPTPTDGLTEREREVLRLVATGMTNREIADALTISEHTVARHLQNLFSKLSVSTRAAATAYAYEHGIV